MPYKSLLQKKLVQAAAHNKDFADKVGFEQKAAQKFEADADKHPIEKAKSTFKFKKLKDKLGLK